MTGIAGPKYVSGVADPVVKLTRESGATVTTPVAMLRGCVAVDNGDGTTTLTLSDEES